MNKTERIMEYAMNQASPEHGEGWDDFKDQIKAEMLKMEALLDALVSQSEVVFRHHDKIAPYEEHEMHPSTPNPDIYWSVLMDAKDYLA